MGAFLITEHAAGIATLHNDSGTLISGQNLQRGAVLGKITLGAVTAAAKGGGNTGNGTCTPDVSAPRQAYCQAGVYAVRCAVAGVNSATFRLFDPKGNFIEEASLSGAGASAQFTKQIRFTVTDGSTDFVVGDGFDLTVAAGSGKYTQLAPAALDGSQYAAGVLLGDADASGGDRPIVVAARLAEVDGGGLTWPGGITAAQKTDAIALLRAALLVVR